MTDSLNVPQSRYLLSYSDIVIFSTALYRLLKYTSKLQLLPMNYDMLNLKYLVLHYLHYSQNLMK